MNDFDYENKLKKDIARGAFHKKNGSKSKGCHLPSDDLSAAQRKKLNGPCKTVNLHQPMTWREFKSLDHDIQQKYYDECFEYYGPTLTAFAKMMGTNIKTVQTHFRRFNLCLHNDKRYRMSDTQKEMWAAFCNGVVGGGDGKKSSDSIIPPEAKGYQFLNDVYDALDIPNHSTEHGWITEDDAQERSINLGDIPEKDTDGQIKLDFNIITPTVAEAANEAVEKEEQQKTLDQLRFERDFYKERYFELLAILSERK